VTVPQRYIPVTIYDAVPHPQLLFTSAVREGRAAERTPVTITLRRPAEWPFTSTYSVEIGGGAAGFGTDYAYTSRPLTFAPGQMEMTFRIDVIGDDAAEPIETVPVKLVDYFSTSTVLAEATLTILDDDGPSSAAMMAADTSVGELTDAATEAVFTVSLAEASQNGASVQYATEDGSALAGSDYLPLSGTLLFAPGETSKTIRVTVLGDAELEAIETFRLLLLNAAGATVSDAAGEAMIFDDDVHDVPPPVLHVANITAHERDAVATFTLTLSVPMPEDGYVDVATENGTAIAGSDFEHVVQRVALPRGTTSVPFTVRLIADGTAELHETFTLSFTSPHAAVPPGKPVCTIADGDGEPRKRSVRR
jgi:Calx-beta domain